MTIPSPIAETFVRAAHAAATGSQLTFSSLSTPSTRCVGATSKGARERHAQRGADQTGQHGGSRNQGPPAMHQAVGSQDWGDYRRNRTRQSPYSVVAPGPAYIRAELISGGNAP
jgi:hypothetical protein